MMITKKQAAKVQVEVIHDELIDLMQKLQEYDKFLDRLPDHDVEMPADTPDAHEEGGFCTLCNLDHAIPSILRILGQYNENQAKRRLDSYRWLLN